MSNRDSYGEDSMKRKEKEQIAILLSAIIVVAAIAAYGIIRSSSGQAGTWKLFGQFSGAGINTTTEFTMTNRWRIVYSIEKRIAYDEFVIDVFIWNGTGYPWFTTRDESDTTATQGILSVDQTGTFFIQVNDLSDTKWSLQIEEFVKST
jgi:hypothetical protein